MFSKLSIAPVLSGDQLTRLARLRQIPGVLPKAPTAPHFEFEGIPVPRGAITEISGPAGSGKTEWTLRFIRQTLRQNFDQHSQNCERIGSVETARVCWIEDVFTANPRGFAEHGLDLSHFLFVEGGRDSLWATHQVLRSQLFDAVVLWVRESVLSVSEPSVELRKLQLSAEQAGVPLLLLSPHPRPTGVNWPVALQIAMDPRTRTAQVLDKSPRSEEVDHERRKLARPRLGRSGLRTA